MLDNKIAYYRINYEYPDKSNNADFFGIMDLNGNVIGETQVSDAGRANFRLKKAGDYICFMSGYKMDMDYTFDTPMDGIIFYDCMTGKQKTFYPVDGNENSFCTVTPNGKYLVTGILVKENYYTIKDHSIKLYDIESQALIESEDLGTGGASFFAMCAYNDRVILTGGGAVTHIFKTQ